MSPPGFNNELLGLRRISTLQANLQSAEQSDFLPLNGKYGYKKNNKTSTKQFTSEWPPAGCFMESAFN